jgi:hypothetical protein
MTLPRLGAIALGISALCSSAFAVEPWVLYDDFSAALSPNKWPDLGLERNRTTAGGVLVMMQRDWGDTANGDVGQRGNSWSEPLSRPTPVTLLRSYVRINEIDLTGCGNTQSTRVRARVMGTLFNTGNRSTGSNVGDVFAQAYLYRDSNSPDAAGVLRVEGRLLMCTASDCNSSTALGSIVSLGTANLRQNVLLQIEWDRALKQVSFVRDQGAQSGTVSYNDGNRTLDDSAEPGNPFKSVGVRTDVANCASGPRTTGYVAAQFDYVSVNKSAKP